MNRSTWILAALLVALVPTLEAQAQSAFSYLPSAVSEADSRRLTADSRAVRGAVHYGKWLTAAGTATFTLMAAREHRFSRREWDALLDICRSADEACATGPDGRYLRADAEQRYQNSRAFDKKANRRLLGAQVSLLVTAALFILDLRPGAGPENIPFAPVRVTVEPTGDGAAAGVRIAF